MSHEVRKVVKLVETDVATRVLGLLLGDDDLIVEVKYIKGQQVHFTPLVNYTSTELIDLPRLKDVSLEKNHQFTRFDELSLSVRSPIYQQKVVDSFARNYLFASRVMDLESARALSVAAAHVIHSFLDSEHSLNTFLVDPAPFLAAREQDVDSLLTENERTAFLNLAQDTNAMRQEFDQVALGESAGDGDTYILMGSEPETGIPTKDALLWLHENLANFVSYHGYMPGYGGYVTEANLRNHVVLGPGTTDRDRDFLARNGIKTYDRRDWQPIGTLE